MPTSDDRREVAAKLKQMADAHDATEASRVARALGLEYKVYGTVVAFGSADICNLADLIDPTCHKVIPSEMEGCVFCSNCGAEIGEYGVPNYCHNCGHRVVSGDGE